MDGVVPKGSAGTEGRIVPFVEVVLTTPVRDEGEDVPRGATGTVVEMLPGDRACIVEFFEPRHCVVTVDLGLLRPAIA